MIEAVFGDVIDRKPGSVLIKTAGGLAYRVLVPISYHARFELGQSVSLRTVYKIREDESFLYGFLTEKELELFRKITTVSGVGGKTALAILSTYSIEEITHIFLTQDDKRIAAVPGIGKKTALRLILELSGGLATQHKETDAMGSPLSFDLISALINLGYQEKKAREAVSEIMKRVEGNEAFELLFKRTLKEVSKR